MNLIQTLEAEEIARLGKKIPEFAPGDTVIVSVNVVEGTRKRVQAYEGVVIAKRNRGLNSGFTVRKISSGEGVERTFQTYSPLIAGIEVKRRGDVRRAKLYYLRERKFMDRQPMQAAVLVGVVMRDEPTVLLTQRPAHMSTHPGQIAFAGGKRDPEDRNIVDTALREAQEEIGLDPQHVQVLGTLPEYITGSVFHVTPVVALIEPHMQLALNTHEVADAFEVPLAFLMNPAHHRWHRYTFEGQEREWLSMPYLDGDQLRFVWGATAGMLRNFYRFLAA